MVNHRNLFLSDLATGKALEQGKVLAAKHHLRGVAIET